MKDADKDGVINLLDCKPFNKKEQGFLHRIKTQKGAGKYQSQVQGIVNKMLPSQREAEIIRENLRKFEGKTFHRKMRQHQDKYQGEDTGFFDMGAVPGIDTQEFNEKFGKPTPGFTMDLIVEKGIVKGDVVKKRRGEEKVEIKTIYVRPEYRKQGMAKKTIAATFRDPKIKSIVGVSIPTAKRTWEKLGAVRGSSAEEAEALKEFRQQTLDAIAPGSNTTYEDLPDELKNVIDKGGSTFELTRENFEKKYPDKETIYSWQADEEKIYPSERGKFYDGKHFAYRGRGTGHHGTGIYGYKRKHIAKAANSPDRLSGEMYPGSKLIKVEVKKPLRVKGTYEGFDFHAALRDIERIDPKKKKIVSQYGEKELDTIKEQFRKQGISDVTDEELIQADKEWEKTGVKQANIILKKRGYGGIVPESESLDTHEYGAIKFEEDEVPMSDFEEVDLDEPTPEVLKDYDYDLDEKDDSTLDLPGEEDEE